MFSDVDIGGPPQARVIGTSTMPALTVLAVVGLALIALLFVANEKLEPVSPVITSQRLGLPNSRHHVATQSLTAAPAPAPDMSSPAVLAAQPKSESDAVAKIGSAAREARAQAQPKKARIETTAKNRTGVPQEAKSEALAKKGRAEALSQELSVEASAKKARTEPPSQDASSHEAPSQNDSVSQQQFDRFSIKSH
jgi:hypothetical protein